MNNNCNFTRTEASDSSDENVPAVGCWTLADGSRVCRGVPECMPTHGLCLLCPRAPVRERPPHLSFHIALSQLQSALKYSNQRFKNVCKSRDTCLRSSSRARPSDTHTPHDAHGGLVDPEGEHGEGNAGETLPPSGGRGDARSQQRPLSAGRGVAGSPLSYDIHAERLHALAPCQASTNGEYTVYVRTTSSNDETNFHNDIDTQIMATPQKHTGELFANTAEYT